MVRSLVLLLVGLYTLSVLAPTVDAKNDQNLTLCDSTNSDTVIYSARHVKDYEDDKLFTSETVELNFQGMVITCINVINRWSDGTGGVVTLKSGGLGFSHVTIYLRGQVLRGYSFNVKIHGRPGTPTPATTAGLVRPTEPTTTPEPTTPAVISRASSSEVCYCNQVHCTGNLFDESIFIPNLIID